MQSNIVIGMPRMHKESGERRDFLPRFVAEIQKRDANAVLEYGYGSGMGIEEKEYMNAVPFVRFGSHEEVYRQSYVLVLRSPSDDELRLLQPGACLLSMLHYPTRPDRVALLRSLKLEAVSLDSIKDDTGRRLVENLKSVAWNGVRVAMQTLESLYPDPGFESPQRRPLRVTLLGSGAVGTHVVPAAIRYADQELRSRLVASGVPGVQVTVVDYDITGHKSYMKEILQQTDLLVDATQRPDPSRPVIPNDWIAFLPEYAVILDLSVDPYNATVDPPQVKGIEGIPQGSLDQYIFAPDDPAYSLIPDFVSTRYRRHAVTCYSWPGIVPEECMHVYGKQLLPIIRNIIERGGIEGINPRGRFFERAIARAQLSRWPPAGNAGSGSVP